MSQQILSNIGRIGLFGTTIAILSSKLFFIVEPGHRSLIFDHFGGGTLDKIYSEGIHFIIPFIRYPIPVDIRTTPHIINSITGTKDLQSVAISLRVLSRPNIDALPEIYRSLSLDFQGRVLPSIGNEVLKAVVAQYNADQLLTQRDQVSKEIRNHLNSRCKHFNIILDDVSLTHLTFSDDFSRAIEEKQVAEQRAERAKFIVARTEQEKYASIIKSEGDAEAAKLVSDAIQKSGAGLLEIRRIETALNIARTLAEDDNVTYIPHSVKSEDGNSTSSGGVMMLINQRR